MAIKDLLKRKPKYEYKVKPERKKAKHIKTEDEIPWLWCEADDGELDDPTLYMRVDSEEMIIEEVTLEGENVGTNMDIIKMKQEIEKWKKEGKMQ